MNNIPLNYNTDILVQLYLYIYTTSRNNEESLKVQFPVRELYTDIPIPVLPDIPRHTQIFPVKTNIINNNYDIEHVYQNLYFDINESSSFISNKPISLNNPWFYKIFLGHTKNYTAPLHALHSFSNSLINFIMNDKKYLFILFAKECTQGYIGFFCQSVV